ncbi:MAG: hydrogenase [Thermoanaerobaculum sp.]|nr:MAG: hydrogenase [Thermoanaerobaculum sp.]
MSTQEFFSFFPQSAARLEDVPVLPLSSLADGLAQLVQQGGRILAFFPLPDGRQELELLAVVGDPDSGALRAARTRVSRTYPSLVSRIPQLHLFEREIAERYGVVPEGHPWLKPVRFPKSSQGPWGPLAPGTGPFFQLEGSQVHEVAVGPVHAGVIEPGHFRFQCLGEVVQHLEIVLGYQHRGVEESFCQQPAKRRLAAVETVAGDSTVAHTLAYCEALEALAGLQVSPRAAALRAVALELERLANHVGDLGALAGDVAFLPTASFCGRLRGEILNLTAELCGNRFGRGLLQPGGFRYDLGAETATTIRQRLADLEPELAASIELMLEAPSVLGRFEGTGRLSAEAARELGTVGVAARASGLPVDSRAQFPSGMYRFLHVPMATASSGDVFARAWVRWLEVQHSLKLVEELLGSLPAGELQGTIGPLQPSSLAVGLAEGFRGEVCHVAVTNERGELAAYKIVDPSFHNWSALAYVMRGQDISDFPLCNKSFNLSYCGFDL